MRTFPVLALLVLTILAACGADGAPIRPTDAAPAGLDLSGDVRIGVTTK